MTRRLISTERPAARACVGDAIGLAAICMMVLIGLTVPGVV
ncbi:MAG: hypothetical protein AAGE76_06620 [Pseudomonadota bacterium]